MTATCDIVLPKAVEPLEWKELCSDQRLYNDVLGRLSSCCTHMHAHAHTHMYTHIT